MSGALREGEVCRRGKGSPMCIHTTFVTGGKKGNMKEKEENFNWGIPLRSSRSRGPYHPLLRHQYIAIQTSRSRLDHTIYYFVSLYKLLFKILYAM